MDKKLQRYHLRLLALKFEQFLPSFYLVNKFLNIAEKLNIYSFLVELPNGIQIWWDGLTRAYVDAPAAFMGKTQVK